MTNIFTINIDYLLFKTLSILTQGLVMEESNNLNFLRSTDELLRNGQIPPMKYLEWKTSDTFLAKMI